MHTPSHTRARTDLIGAAGGGFEAVTNRPAKAEAIHGELLFFSFFFPLPFRRLMPLS